MKNFLILILLLVFIISSIIIFLILNYIDPFNSNNLILFSFVFSSFLFVSTFFTLILYFIKKIHYRWQVLLYHIRSSFRQASFIAWFIMWLIYFENIWVPIYFSSFLLCILLVFLELFIQNIYT